ncbi:hypothetical protein PG997_012845 [Apiospora hydei]|uniref:Uncharacterized protein n=1 Tax=Apiospora hydei TaxID=1337664 RepID=A0ABR1V4J6_9PEZI
MLKGTVESLNMKAKRCADRAKQMAGHYHKWLSASCEVHAACCQASTDVSEKQRVNEVHLAAEQVMARTSQQAVDAAKGTMETLQTVLKHADEQYQKAADQFPSGWDLVAQEVVSNLASTATNALNQAIPALIDNYTLTGKMKDINSGMNIFKEGMGGIKGMASADHSDAKAATTAPLPTAPVLPDYYQDPAYTVIKTSAGWVDMLNGLLTSDKGGVNWELAGSTSATDKNSGPGFIKLMMEHDLETLNKKPATTPPSKDLKTILTDCISVCDKVDGFSAPSMSGNRPKNDSEEVKGWISTVHKHNTKSAAMSTISTSIPGPGPSPSPTPPYQKPDGTGLRAQIISAATTKMEQAAAMLTTAQANFKASSDKWVETINSLGAIQAEITKMNADKVHLKLTAFFDSIQSIVEMAVENQVDPFIARISAVDAQPVELGHYNIDLFTAEVSRIQIPPEYVA